MEFEGKYRAKTIMMYTEDGTKSFSREEIEKMERNEDTEDLLNVMKMILEISEEQLLVKIVVTPEEAALAKEEDPDVPFDEEGNLLLEMHEVVCQDGVWKFEMGEMDGETCYCPFAFNDAGDLMYGESIVLERI